MVLTVPQAVQQRGRSRELKSRGALRSQVARPPAAQSQVPRLTAEPAQASAKSQSEAAPVKAPQDKATRDKAKADEGPRGERPQTEEELSKQPPKLMRVLIFIEPDSAEPLPATAPPADKVPSRGAP